MIVKTKIYCYVDETGQDTEGNFFLVAVILKETKELSLLEKNLEEIELITGKRKMKWSKVKLSIKEGYLENLTTIRELQGSIYYSSYRESKEYSKLTSLTIAKAIFAKNYPDYGVSIVIDGLNDSERKVVMKELKSLKIHYRKVRGMKDGQSAFLRLADSMAGFLRDAIEVQAYTRPYLKDLIVKRIVQEI